MKKTIYTCDLCGREDNFQGFLSKMDFQGYTSPTVHSLLFDCPDEMCWRCKDRLLKVIKSCYENEIKLIKKHKRSDFND
jgi:hypothetical protein